MNYTWVTENICVCDDCGASGPTEAAVKHHEGCHAGESERWRKFYDLDEVHRLSQEEPKC